MVDLTGKIITTMTNEESEKLLRMASARGYRTDIGLKAMVNNRLFYFLNFLSGYLLRLIFIHRIMLIHIRNYSAKKMRK